MLAGKQAIVDREHARPGCIRRPVAADLAQARWPAALAAAGFNPAAPAAFVAEGLTWYLPERAAGVAPAWPIRARAWMRIPVTCRFT